MRVIDLINDLFDYRGLQPDKLPKKIRFNNNEFVFKDNSYYHENGINIMRYVDHTVDLRVEVEIIEEPKEKKGFVTNGHRFVPNKDGVSISPVEEYDFTKDPHVYAEEELEEDKEIEKLACDYIVPNCPATENEAYIMSCLLAHEMKINEIINELKKGK